jgi:hypothetical protein
MGSLCCCLLAALHLLLVRTARAMCADQSNFRLVVTDKHGMRDSFSIRLFQNPSDPAFDPATPLFRQLEKNGPRV